MRLKLNVLWFDDQPDTIEQSAKTLKRMLRSVGFDLEVIPVTDYSDDKKVESEITRASREMNVDLILVDYDLGKGIKPGNELAKKIRRSFRHKDIIFYSAHGDGIPRLRQLLFESKIDGAYPVTREGLEDQAFDAIKTIIHKVVDLEHMRGIVMAETSDLDAVISDCLQQAAVHHLDNNGKKTLCDYIFKKLSKGHRYYSNKVEKLKDCQDIKQYLSLHNVIFSSRYRYGALCKAVEVMKWHEHPDYAVKHEKLVKYPEEVKKFRDILAHAKVDNEGNTKVFKGVNNVTLTEDDMVNLRQRILEHTENFARISEALGIPSG